VGVPNRISPPENRRALRNYRLSTLASVGEIFKGDYPDIPPLPLSLASRTTDEMNGQSERNRYPHDGSKQFRREGRTVRVHETGPPQRAPTISRVVRTGLKYSRPLYRKTSDVIVFLEYRSAVCISRSHRESTARRRASAPSTGPAAAAS